MGCYGVYLNTSAFAEADSPFANRTHRDVYVSAMLVTGAAVLGLTASAEANKARRSS